MKNIELDLSRVYGFVPEQAILDMEHEAMAGLSTLLDGSGRGNDFTGWVHLPSSITDDELKDIETLAARIRPEIEVLVVVGIGGSYLGAKAVYDTLSGSFAAMNNSKGAPVMIFAGHNIGEDYMSELLQLLDKKSYAIVVISKSGTTTEPALAFRILKAHLEQKIGVDAARKNIIAVTDASKGALRQVADEEGYKSYVIPDDVGGRFSVLTPVGLVPLAICGVDIRKLVGGASAMEKRCTSGLEFTENPAAMYAATRNALYRKGKKVEILVNYNHKLQYFAEWWKQLYGESEGKEGKGIFPASVNNSSDLHSMGQYIQEGERILFETVISVTGSEHRLEVPEDKANLDKLNFLAGKRIDEVNKMAELGTVLAHIDGGVPNMRIVIPALDAETIGNLIYFFELACGISGYMLDVNPFDQPGVEAYKKNMFALLGKPGFEEETRKIRERI